MPARLQILQLGRGTVGATLIEQVAARRDALLRDEGLDLVYVGIAGRSAAAFDPRGIDLSAWKRAVEAGSGHKDAARSLIDGCRELPGPKVLVDATAEDGMAELYVVALAAGCHIVSCNKKPLAGPLADDRRVREAVRAAGLRWLYEVSVGAGLPTLSTLRTLVQTGDRIESIEGCFSGTLNYLCAALDRGERFSEVLTRARGLGYTEPDPRDDLSGQDVARKALILAREAGLKLEPADVRLEPFCSTPAGGPVEAFLASCVSLDAPLARDWEEARRRGMRKRFVAAVGDGCGASLREVPADSPLGRLAGPENIFIFRTQRYHDHPLLIAGPGAGPAVTAAGAFGDILDLARSAAARGAR